MPHCAAAILAPTAILFWLQYRSLDQLRAKTRIAVQDEVRQKLETLRQDLENRVTAAASEICGYLTNSLNEIPGNPNVRAKALAPIEEPMPDWLADPTVLLVCTHSAGGSLVFVSNRAG